MKNIHSKGFTSKALAGPRNISKKHMLLIQSTESSKNLVLHSTGLNKNFKKTGAETTAYKNSLLKNSNGENFSDVFNLQKKKPTLDDLRNKMTLSVFYQFRKIFQELILTQLDNLGNF